MQRDVTRDSNEIVYHLVREVRDEEQAGLSYTAKVGEIPFRRDPGPKAAQGAGSSRSAQDRRRDPQAVSRHPQGQQRERSDAVVQALICWFRELKASASEHEQILGEKQLKKQAFAAGHRNLLIVRSSSRPSAAGIPRPKLRRGSQRYRRVSDTLAGRLPKFPKGFLISSGVPLPNLRLAILSAEKYILGLR
jgi:hypothetical protein